MAINIEVKHRLQAIEARVKDLEFRLEQMALVNLAPKLVEATKQMEAAQKLCPHCGEKPAYFFHVRSCLKKKNKNNGDDGNRSTSSA